MTPFLEGRATICCSVAPETTPCQGALATTGFAEGLVRTACLAAKGNDVLYATAGSGDVLSGGSGHDVIYANDGEPSDHALCGAGVDGSE